MHVLGSTRKPYIVLSADLRAEYLRLFDSCQIRPSRRDDLRLAVTRLRAGRGRYRALESQLGVPWFVTGALHCLECDFDFGVHLHNGDPLTARTVNEPQGCPANGSPPFSWRASARDALRRKDLSAWRDWSIPGTLYQLERYNGWGYRLCHPEVLSPYLWSGSQHYTRGKYIADHRWSASAASAQIGAAVLLKALHVGGSIQFAPADEKLSPNQTPPSGRLRDGRNTTK